MIGPAESTYAPTLASIAKRRIPQMSDVFLRELRRNPLMRSSARPQVGGDAPRGVHRRGGLATLGRYGRSWYTMLALKWWGRITEADYLEAARGP